MGGRTFYRAAIKEKNGAGWIGFASVTDAWEAAWSIHKKTGRDYEVWRGYRTNTGGFQPTEYLGLAE
jgi:hypothetical protein